MDDRFLRNVFRLHQVSRRSMEVIFLRRGLCEQ